MFVFCLGYVLQIGMVRVCVFRCHVVEEFNRGIYDYIIATDDVGISKVDGKGKGSSNIKALSRKRKRDKEYGVARGIDFQGLYTSGTYCIEHVCFNSRVSCVWESIN